MAASALLSGCAGTSQAASFGSFGHVHAIEMDVQAGVLYVASHHGVWEVAVPDSAGGFPQHGSVEPRQVADRAQDTMGFTITADGAMFASGHPDPAEYPDFNPPNLGLIRSTDGAETWDHISLQEEADFHALEAVALDDSKFRIYGYDSTAGMLRISDDTGESWRVGADLDAFDLASTVGEPGVLYATTPTGLQRSVDAGMTFAPFHPESTLALIEPLASGLVGVDSAGKIWHQVGDSLTKGGSVNGQFDAFGAFENGDDTWLLISDESGIGVSKDWGETWTNVVAR
ncbi:WD40/YVTN/BNR-like repeat-containing protein [Mycetocola sp.]|uniref:WD40/YVTN/BNR-like repeat-containing protein n=1 Tax=Mycetocola sp. TaxID=1871042 RepID=UPI003989F786